MSTRAVSAVFEHSVSKGSARLVLLAMADEANDQGLLTAYRRSRSHLARKANVDEASARRAVKTLTGLGELQVLAIGDGRTSSDYRLTLPGLAPIEGLQDAPPAPAARTGSGDDVSPLGLQGAPPVIPVSPAATPVLPLDGVPPPAPVGAAAAFEDFWSAYPRKTAKGTARKAWPAAVRAAGGDVDMLTESAARFAADPNREERFTPHASTWLNGERWNDPALPSRTGRSSTGPRAAVDPSEEARRRQQPAGRITAL